MHDIIIKAGEFILAISILVVIHELGHFLAARMFGIRVEKFFLFFDVGGVKLFSFKRGDTTYGIGWLPLGGYVKITGMIDESMDKNFAASVPQPYEFRSKPAWQRLIVMLAGIFNNVVLGILIFSMHTWYYGDQYVPASELNNGIVAHSLGVDAGFKTGDIIVAINGEKLRKANDVATTRLLLEDNIKYDLIRNGKPTSIVMPKDIAKKIIDKPDSFIEIHQKFAVDDVSGADNPSAKNAGLKAGDTIVSVNDTLTPYFNDITRIFSHNKNKMVTVAVLHAGDKTLTVLKGKIDEQGHFGFKPKMNFATEKYGFIPSVGVGLNKAWHAVSDNVKGLGRLISGALPAKSLHSLIGIAGAFPSSWDWSGFWMLTGLLSMVLAFMNLLPIPALDGGHVIFLLVEMVRRKPVSIKVLEVAQMVGMGFLFLLMGFALYNDITQMIFKR
jgi:regulator of sigma E protease